MNLSHYFKKAQKEGWAIGQFNISNLELLRAAFEAAKNLKSPIIIGTSESESRYIGLRQAALLVKSLREESGLPIFSNLDHGRTFEYIKEAIDAGYDTVHFDGSKLPLKENIKIAKKVSDYAHKKGILIEGEVGIVAGVSGLHREAPAVAERNPTDPAEAKYFVQDTNVDRLAINIGTFHGLLVSGEKHRIDLDRLSSIKKAVGTIPLVLHGGSGISVEDIKKAIKGGVVKININAAMRLAYTSALKNSLRENPEEIVPYNYFPQVIKAVQKVVEEKIKVFGSFNKI